MTLGRTRGQRCLKWVSITFALCLALCGNCPAQQQKPAGQPPATAVQTASPALPAYHLSPAKMQQAIEFGRIRHWLHFGSEIWTLFVLWLLLATGSAARMAESIVRRGRRGWLSSAIFSALLATVVFLVADLPPSLIGHIFSLRYGISVQPWGLWFIDASKTFQLSVLGGTFLFMLAYGLVCWSPRRYWLWLSAAMIPLTLVGAYVLPTIIDPMYDKFDQLGQTHPALVTQLERVVERTGTRIPESRMFLMKASSKSNGLNAYVTGLGSSKRIVVWDTTADRMPTDEILFTFAHETGHYVLNHIPKGLTLAAFGIVALFWLSARMADWLILRWGSRWRVPSVASLPGLVVLLFSLTVMQYLTEPVSNTISRFFEHEADVYGQEAIHGLVPDPQQTAVGAFNQMGEAYLDDPNPSPFIEFWSYDHPSTQSRATFAAQYDPWAPGKSPRFFTKLPAGVH